VIYVTELPGVLTASEPYRGTGWRHPGTLRAIVEVAQVAGGDVEACGAAAAHAGHRRGDGDNGKQAEGPMRRHPTQPWATPESAAYLLGGVPRKPRPARGRLAHGLRPAGSPARWREKRQSAHPAFLRGSGRSDRGAGEWDGQDSNLRTLDYESSALTC
jgi:hypothetical protein